MRAMLLAAGRGERMRPLTDTTPKPLVKAGGIPLIEWHLRKLAAAGFVEVIVNNAWLGEQVHDFLGDGHRWGLQVRHSPEPEALETAGGIAQALAWLGDEPFLVMNADIWTDWDPCHAISMSRELMSTRQALANLIMVPNPCHHPEGDFHLRPDGKITDYVVDGSQTHSKLTFSGIAVYHPAFFADVPRGTRMPLAPLLREHMAHEAVVGQVHHGEWHDIGTMERLQKLERLLAHNRS